MKKRDLYYENPNKRGGTLIFFLIFGNFFIQIIEIEAFRKGDLGRIVKRRGVLFAYVVSKDPSKNFKDDRMP